MNVESYKGIEFVRISGLPQDEQAMIHKTMDQTKIIKILRESVVLSDCIQIKDYDEWKLARKPGVSSSPASASMVKELKLAFK